MTQRHRPCAPGVREGESVSREPVPWAMQPEAASRIPLGGFLRRWLVSLENLEAALP